jgi:hypothetical protein
MLKVVYKIIILSFLLAFFGFFAGKSLAAYVFNNDLRRGSSGEDVWQLQVFLNSSPDTLVAESGFGSPGQETDYFGPLTQNAVVRFQIKYNIEPAVGFFGPITRAKVNSLNSANPDYSYAPTNNQATEQAPSSDYSYDPAQESATEEAPVNSPYSPEAQARYSWLTGGTSTQSGIGSSGTGLYLYNQNSMSGFGTSTGFGSSATNNYYNNNYQGSASNQLSALGLEEPKYPFGGWVVNLLPCPNQIYSNKFLVQLSEGPLSPHTQKRFIWKVGTSKMLSATKQGQTFMTGISFLMLPNIGFWMVGNLKEHKESCGAGDFEVISYGGQCLFGSEKNCVNYYKNFTPAGKTESDSSSQTGQSNTSSGSSPSYYNYSTSTTTNSTTTSSFLQGIFNYYGTSSPSGQ